MMDIAKFPIAILKAMPKPLIRPIAFKYVAGEEVKDAVKKVLKLNKSGIKATLDILGEASIVEGDVKNYTRQYIELVREIVRNNLDSGISVKPTALGLGISYDLALTSIREVISEAREHNVFVRIDMEDSPYTGQTIELYNTLRGEYGRVGIVFQAYLKRTINDIEELAGKGADVRLCKGIYREPAMIAIKGYKNINRNFLACLRRMFLSDFKVAIATHDRRLFKDAKGLVKELDMEKDRYEFQMLYGVKPGVDHDLCSEGHRVRLYVPYGKDWYPYSMRRMDENPVIAFYVAKAVFLDSFAFIFRKIAGR